MNPKEKLAELEEKRKKALDKESKATMEREKLDRQIQALRRRQREGEANLPLAVNPGDWTQTK